MRICVDVPDLLRTNKVCFLVICRHHAHTLERGHGHIFANEGGGTEESKPPIASNRLHLFIGNPVQNTWNYRRCMIGV